ncbi:restriction endonuclease [Campylobacter fetus]|uniref:restriction endonuclease n=1 Tax=Campylobacter fetus TaxID=196 RepID=UPI000FCA3C0B|nr:restriction endonuclease [Campylobacter fetus]QQF52875.1 restriction endonuclease [Campylobacter fetus subsp. venerealis]RUT49937.1 restriction endonuclease [Campylobacter fetus]RUT50198.1 restriction endonuclease [Campylobacter fetus]
MMSAVCYATKHFCTDTLGFELEDGSKLGKDVYGASIPVYKDNEEYQFFLYFKRDTLKYFAKVLLNVSDEKHVDLGDLSREVANQIIGYAKNLLNDRHDGKYKLGTPEFLGKVESFPVKLAESKLFKMKNRTFKIGYKKA